jgi:CCR4-NOT transcriptional regulation complex NOT5 subunit
METYKQFEKDSKTKAYSNDGLASAKRTDPREDEKNQGRKFIKRA